MIRELVLFAIAIAYLHACSELAEKSTGTMIVFII
jgi:hypothetical protein